MKLFLKLALFFCVLIIFEDNSLPILIPRYKVQDIDTYEDWERAEIIFKAINC